MTGRRWFWSTAEAGGPPDVDRPYYDDADIIFSHIKMRSDYAGYWARIERSSDGDVMDVAFLANRLPDLASTNSFRGSDVLSIKWLYNQGTFTGTDADNAAKNGGRVNPNFNAIIHDGTDWIRIGDWLALDNNIPSVIDNRIARYEFPYTTAILDKNHMAFSVFKNASLASGQTTFYWKLGETPNDGAANRWINHANDNRSSSGVSLQYQPDAGGNLLNNRNPENKHEQHTITRNSTTLNNRYNGTSVSTGTITNVFASHPGFILSILGSRSASNSNDYNNKTRGMFQELIIYRSFDSTKRNNIEAEQTAFYGTS